MGTTSWWDPLALISAVPRVADGQDQHSLCRSPSQFAGPLISLGGATPFWAGLPARRESPVGLHKSRSKTAHSSHNLGGYVTKSV